MKTSDIKKKQEQIKKLGRTLKIVHKALLWVAGFLIIGGIIIILNSLS